MKLQSLILGAVLVSAPLAWADDAANVMPAESAKPEATGAPVGGWMFFEGSMAHLNYDVKQNREMEGSQNSLGLGLNYFQKDTPWVHHALIGSQQIANNKNEQDFYRMKVDLGTGYRLAETWQVGPTLTALTDSENQVGSSSKIATFAGIQGAKDFNVNGQILRIGAKSLIDLNIPHTTATMSSLFLQFGFGSRADSSVAAPAPAPAPAAAIEKPVVESAAVNDRLYNDRLYKVKEVKPGLYRVSMENVGFALSSSDLKKDNRAELAALGKTLAANKALVKEVLVEGHTDKTGPLSLNKTLSLLRAQSGKAALTEGGLKKSSILTVGKADKEPVSAELDPNRRIEVLIKSDAKAEELEKALNQ